MRFKKKLNSSGVVGLVCMRRMTLPTGTTLFHVAKIGSIFPTEDFFLGHHFGFFTLEEPPLSETEQTYMALGRPDDVQRLLSVVTSQEILLFSSDGCTKQTLADDMRIAGRVAHEEEAKNSFIKRMRDEHGVCAVQGKIDETSAISEILLIWTSERPFGVYREIRHSRFDRPHLPKSRLPVGSEFQTLSNYIGNDPTLLSRHEAVIAPFRNEVAGVISIEDVRGAHDAAVKTGKVEPWLEWVWDHGLDLLVYLLLFIGTWQAARKFFSENG